MSFFLSLEGAREKQEATVYSRGSKDHHVSVSKDCESARLGWFIPLFSDSHDLCFDSEWFRNYPVDLFELIWLGNTTDIYSSWNWPFSTFITVYTVYKFSLML